MNLWRVQLVRTRSEQPGVDRARFCVGRSVLGVGWGVGPQTAPVTGPQYRSLCVQAYGKVPRSVGYMLDDMRERNHGGAGGPGDLCWFRVGGLYHLAEVVGGWRYVADPVFAAADVFNVRDVRALAVGPAAAVPWAVVKLFFRGPAVRRINNPALVPFSQALYNRLSGRPPTYRPILPPASDVFDFIDADGCEDVVAMYVQDLGFQLIPSTCKRDSKQFEYDFVHRADGRLAAAQVKNGRVDLSVADYQGYPGEVFLFTAKGRYLPAPGPSPVPGNRVHCLDPGAVERYMRSNEPRMPPKVRTWLSLCP